MSSEMINQLFVTDINKIGQILVKSNPIIIYDTCAISHHARPNVVTGKFDIIDYFTEDDCVIVTDKIIEEISKGTGGGLSPYYADYFGTLKEKAKALILLIEKDWEALLGQRYDGKERIKEIIKEAATKAFSQTYIKANLFKLDVKSSSFFIELFGLIDKIEANRGEISIFMTAFILDRIKKKHIKIITDDRSALTLLGQLGKSLEVSDFAIISTLRIFQHQYAHNLAWKAYDLDTLNLVLDSVRTDQNNKVLFQNIADNTLYDKVYEKVLTNRVLIDRMIEKSIRIRF